MPLGIGENHTPERPICAISRTRESQGCRIASANVTTNNMSRVATSVKERVAAQRARQLAAGRVVLNTYVPGDLIEAIDKIKERRGVSGRASLIEEALRLLIEKELRA